MEFLPENFQTVLQNPTFTYLQSATQSHLMSKLTHLRTMIVQPYLIEPLSEFMASHSSSTPDLLTICLLAIILFISLKILGYAYRVVMFWVTLVFRLVFWGSLIAVGYHIYNVGPEKSYQDFGWLWGVLYGFVNDFQEKGKAAAAAYAAN
ncbi:unnamed protein product [Penicillium olsonii]|uniref:Uncharacterized protein n=1 Tax=Penicillium olsonii TaxID=99116 RepID=A0A9W4MUG7_PENOL|nr:unnamed protein product [Penicillium olsonii]CAG8127948.1 unnamed protein product [Penicillium olsonii]